MVAIAVISQNPLGTAAGGGGCSIQAVQEAAYAKFSSTHLPLTLSCALTWLYTNLLLLSSDTHIHTHTRTHMDREIWL